jgi:hypothetical protein
MSQPRIVLHIGLPKTGTTSLQLNLFVPHRAWSFVGKPLVHSNAEMKRLLRPIVEFDAERWEREFAGYRRELVAPLLARCGDLLLISEEEFSTGTARTRVDRETIARRLQQVFPQARVLLTIRNQLDVLPSVYGQLVNMGILPARLSFRSWVDTECSREGRKSRLYLFDYAELITLYRELFSSENLRVLLFEELRRDATLYVEDMCRFIGVDPAPAVATFQENHRRNVNARITQRHARWRSFTQAVGFIPWDGILIKAGVRPAFARFLERGKPLDTTLSGEQKEFLARFYAPSNRATADLLGVDLAAYGYPC